MQISEIIQILQNLENQYGDIEIETENEYNKVSNFYDNYLIIKIPEILIK